MRFLAKIVTDTHSDAFPAFAEDVPPRIVKGACGGGVVWLHYGERGGKRFGPLEEEVRSA
jgi:hypothetical protein